VNILNSVPTTVADTVEFGYDGFGRRVHIDEKHGSTVLTDKTYLWVGAGIAEERDSLGSNVYKRYFGKGFQVVSGDNQGNYYYSKDHLGSIREVTNTAGAVVAKYDYDLWGRQTKVSGTIDADFGFTGFYMSRSTGLDLTWFRAYSPEMGRWLSRDRLAEKAGYNLNRYTNNPLRFIDPYGLQVGIGGPFDNPYQNIGNNIINPINNAINDAGNNVGNAIDTVGNAVVSTNQFAYDSANNNLRIVFDNKPMTTLDETLGTIPDAVPITEFPPINELIAETLNWKTLMDWVFSLVDKYSGTKNASCPINQ